MKHQTLMYMTKNQDPYFFLNENFLIFVQNLLREFWGTIQMRKLNWFSIKYILAKSIHSDRKVLFCLLLNNIPILCFLFKGLSRSTSVCGILILRRIFAQRNLVGQAKIILKQRIDYFVCLSFLKWCFTYSGSSK